MFLFKKKIRQSSVPVMDDGPYGAISRLSELANRRGKEIIELECDLRDADDRIEQLASIVEELQDDLYQAHCQYQAAVEHP